MARLRYSNLVHTLHSNLKFYNFRNGGVQKGQRFLSGDMIQQLLPIGAQLIGVFNPPLGALIQQALPLIPLAQQVMAQG